MMNSLANLTFPVQKNSLTNILRELFRLNIVTAVMFTGLLCRHFLRYFLNDSDGKSQFPNQIKNNLFYVWAYLYIVLVSSVTLSMHSRQKR